MGKVLKVGDSVRVGGRSGKIVYIEKRSKLCQVEFSPAYCEVVGMGRIEVDVKKTR